MDAVIHPVDAVLIDEETDSAEVSNNASESITDAKKIPGQTPQFAKASMISTLTASGLLTSHSRNKLRFSNPIFLGYLAGKGIVSRSPNNAALINQPEWAGQTTTLRYMAAIGDATDSVNALLSKDDPILMRPILKAARMLGDSRQSHEATWHGLVITALLRLLQNDDLPIGLRGEAMMAIALSHQTNVIALFRQLLLAPSNELRQLAALGVGMVRDSKSIETLKILVANSLESTRKAACLALVEIGTPPALEAVAMYLLRGDEQLRIYSAEALANHPIDGQEALREGLNSEDILVRRAIVFGLSRVNEPWSQELLEKTQLNDEQWAVRNVAVEFLQARQQPDPHIPSKNTPPHETPWLIEFAGKYGMGVSPGQPATDIFLLALKDSNREYFQSALFNLRNSPNENVIAALYPHLFGTDPDAKEAVFQTLSYMALGGASLPDPRQFGLG
jgi:HEAT repeat protein